MTPTSPPEPIVRYVARDRVEAWIAAGWAVRLNLDGRAVLMQWIGEGAPVVPGAVDAGEPEGTICGAG